MKVIILKYSSKGKTISRSMQHDGLWIIDYASGDFATINTTEADMLRMNPPDHIMMKTTEVRF